MLRNAVSRKWRARVNLWKVGILLGLWNFLWSSLQGTERGLDSSSSEKYLSSALFTWLFFCLFVNSENLRDWVVFPQLQLPGWSHLPAVACMPVMCRAFRTFLTRSLQSHSWGKCRQFLPSDPSGCHGLAWKQDSCNSNFPLLDQTKDLI